jgi:hypothetical protein
MRQMAAGLTSIAFATVAGAASTSFNVNITLSAAPAISGICVSQTLTEQANALVRVVCQTRQFVSITPRDGKPILGVHGGAFRYRLGMGSTLPAVLASEAAPYIGGGTVTALRVYNADGLDGPWEMLVSF